MSPIDRYLGHRRMPPSFICRLPTSLRSVPGPRNRPLPSLGLRPCRHRLGLSSRALATVSSPRSSSTVQSGQPSPRTRGRRHARRAQDQSWSPASTTPVSSGSPETRLGDAVDKRLGTKLATTISCGRLKLWKGPNITCRDGEELVCSYNWVIDETERHRPLARINVPGELPVYCPGKTPIPTQLNPDPPGLGRPEGSPDAGCMSWMPYEAVFLATQVMNPTFRFDKIDVLVSAGLLYLLLRFCNQHGPVAGHAGQDDRIAIEFFAINGTLVLYGSESTRVSWGNSKAGRLYGMSFETAFTSKNGQINGTTSETHWRLLRYRLGDLNCGVLFEADASWRNPDEMDEMADSKSTGPPTMYSHGGDVPIFRQGAGAEQANVVELKAKHWQQTGALELEQKDQDRSPLGFQSVFVGRNYYDLPPLWFARVPIVVIGYHHEGLFQEVRNCVTGPEVLAWERTGSQPHGLRRLVTLLHRMCHLAQAGGRTYLANYRATTSRDRLEIRESKKHVKMPKYIIDRLWTAQETTTPPGKNARPTPKAEDNGEKRKKEFGQRPSPRKMLEFLYRLNHGRK